MVSSMTTWMKNILAGHVHGAAWTQPSPVYVGLATGVSDSGTITGEPGGGIGYARFAVDNNDTSSVWAAAVNGSVANHNAAITFGPATSSWGTLSKVFVVDGLGHTMYWSDLVPSIAVVSGDSVNIAVDTFVFTIA